MTLIDVAFRYGAQPTEAQTRAMARVRDVYGVWRMTLDAKERTLRVEYDASRLSEREIAGLLRSAGIGLLVKSVHHVACQRGLARRTMSEACHCAVLPGS